MKLNMEETEPQPTDVQAHEPELPSLATPDSRPGKLCGVIRESCLKLLSLGVLCYAAVGT